MKTETNCFLCHKVPIKNTYVSGTSLPLFVESRNLLPYKDSLINPSIGALLQISAQVQLWEF